MAKDLRQNLDERTRKIAGARVENGQELESFNGAQQQLLAIHAEQQQNLAVARAEAKATSGNNQVLQQAGELAAMSSSSSEPQQIQSVNPATQAILSKYGVGQPRFQKSHTSSQTVTKQNIVINNNTTNTTTNNVQVPTGGGPIQGRPIMFKQPAQGQDSLAKFKNWMSSAFTRQSEEAAKRDREYQRREWSLTRSANKMMKKLSDVGKTIGERMDPRRIGATWTSQLKTLLFLFGFGLLAKNWTKILTTVSKIEENIRKFIRYMGWGLKSDEKSGFHKKIISLLGGDPEKDKNAWESLRLLFVGEEGGKPGLFGVLKQYFKDAIEDRKQALGLIKFPDLSGMTNIGDLLGSVVGYLGNILTAILTGDGEKAVREQIRENISSTAAAERAEYEKNNITRNKALHETVEVVDRKQNRYEDIDAGAHAIVSGKFNSFNYEAQEGNFSTPEATISVGNDLRRAINVGKTTGKIQTASIANDLNILNKQTESGDRVVVKPDLLTHSFRASEIEAMKKSGAIQEKEYKYVVVKKDETDYARNGEEGFQRRWAKNMAQTYATDFVLENGNVAGGIRYGAHVSRGLEYAGGTTIGDALNATGSAYRRATANDKKLILVPKEDPRPGVVVDNGDGKTKSPWIKLYAIDNSVVRRLANKLDANKKQGENIDLSDRTFLEGLEKGQRNISHNGGEYQRLKKREEELQTSISTALRSASDSTDSYASTALLSRELQSVQEKIRNFDSGASDIDFAGEFKNLDEYKQEKEKREQRRQEEWEGSRPQKAGTEVVNTAADVFNNTVGEWTSVKINTQVPKTKKDYVIFMRPLLKRVLSSKSFVPKNNVDNYADILTAQSGIESGWGKSGLSSQYNNYSGMTVGTTRHHKTGSKKFKGNHNTFATFQSREDWADEYVEYLNRKFKAFNGDPKNFLTRIKGYAEESTYNSVVAPSINDVKTVQKSIDPNYKPEFITKVFTGSSTGEGTESIQNEEVEEPKSFLSQMVDYVSEFVRTLGGNVTGVARSVTDIDLGMGDKSGLTPSYSYKGPITSEFTDYSSYLKNPGVLKSGMDFIEWQKDVRDKTGSLPLDLTGNLDKEAEKKRQEGIDKDITLEKPELTNYQEYLKSSGILKGDLSFNDWQEQVKNITGRTPEELYKTKTSSPTVTPEEIYGKEKKEGEELKLIPSSTPPAGYNGPDYGGILLPEVEVIGRNMKPEWTWEDYLERPDKYDKYFPAGVPVNKDLFNIVSPKGMVVPKDITINPEETTSYEDYLRKIENLGPDMYTGKILTREEYNKNLIDAFNDHGFYTRSDSLKHPFSDLPENLEDVNLNRLWASIGEDEDLLEKYGSKEGVLDHILKKEYGIKGLEDLNLDQKREKYHELGFTDYDTSDVNWRTDFNAFKEMTETNPEALEKLGVGIDPNLTEASWRKQIYGLYKKSPEELKSEWGKEKEKETVEETGEIIGEKVGEVVSEKVAGPMLAVASGEELTSATVSPEMMEFAGNFLSAKIEKPKKPEEEQVELLHKILNTLSSGNDQRKLNGEIARQTAIATATGVDQTGRVVSSISSLGSAQSKQSIPVKPRATSFTDYFGGII